MFHIFDDSATSPFPSIKELFLNMFHIFDDSATSPFLGHCGRESKNYFKYVSHIRRLGHLSVLGRCGRESKNYFKYVSHIRRFGHLSVFG